MSGLKRTNKTSSRRTHALGGCATCRRRHVKCDQVRPVCLTCRAVGVTCEGFSTSLRWVPSSTAVSAEEQAQESSSVEGTRRQLYTEKARQSMSAALTEEVASSVDESLTELETRSKDLLLSASSRVAVGPFAVLSLASTVPAAGSVNPPPTTDDFHNLPYPLLRGTPSTTDSIFNLDEYLTWTDLFDLGADEFVPMPHSAHDITYQEAGLEAYLTWQEGSLTNLPTQQTPMSAEQLFLDPPQMRPLAEIKETSGPGLHLLDDAHFLLRHFKDHVMVHLSSLKTSQKSPWNVLNLRGAVQTVADVTFLGAHGVKHARLANLFALLSCSACQLTLVPSSDLTRCSDHWEQVKSQASSLAKNHLQQSLRSEVYGPDKSSYKDQLMAVLAMLTFAIISGHQRDARCYMIDAERLLRLRGLAKRTISRKARLLHHVYTWKRIVGESTYLLHAHKNYEVHPTSLENENPNPSRTNIESLRRMPVAEPRSGNNPRMDDFLRIEPHQSDSDLNIDERKESTVGLHDIHLRDSRDYADNMYIQIYGIPETWLSLVSQCTRLANALDRSSRNGNNANADVVGGLHRRVDRLENMICAFASREIPDQSIGGGVDSPQLSPSTHMFRALSSALVIFFYRRVRNVNPWILQGHVADVAKALCSLEDLLTRYPLAGPGTVWPAFMAACEAIAPTNRDILIRWIDQAATKCGFSEYWTAKIIISEVWQRQSPHFATPETYTGSKRTSETGRNASRSEDTSKRWTWMDVCREKGLWLMPC